MSEGAGAGLTPGLIASRAPPGRREGVNPGLLRDTAVLAVGDLAARCLSWATFVHLARVLQPAAYGALEITLSAMVFLTVAVDLGLGRLGVREVARKPEDLGDLARLVLSPQLLAALVAYSGIAAVAFGFVRDPVLKVLLLGYGLSLPVLPFIVPWAFQALGRMNSAASLAVLRQTVFAAAVFAAVSSPAQATRLPLAEIAAVGLTACVSLLRLGLAGQRVAIGFRAENLRLVRESWAIGVSQGVWALRMHLPTVLLGVVAGQAMAGFFGVAHRIFMVAQTPLGFFFTALLPRLSAIAPDDPEPLNRALRRSVHLAVWPSLALALALTFTAEPVIGAVFGRAYAGTLSPTVLASIVWVIPALAVRGAARTILVVLNRQREELACSLFGLALLTVLAPSLTGMYGPAGAAWAMVVSETVLAAGTWWRARSRVGELVRAAHPAESPP